MKNLKKFMCFVVIFGPQCILTYFDKQWQTNLIFLASSVLFLFILNPDVLTELTIQKDGVSFKLREAIKEAYATIDMIKQTMDPIIRLQADIVKTSGTFNSMTVEELLRAKSEMMDLADQLDLKDAQNYYSDETWPRISGAATSELLDLFFAKHHLNGEDQFGKTASKLRTLFYESFDQFVDLANELASKITDNDDRNRAKYLISVSEEYHNHQN